MKSLRAAYRKIFMPTDGNSGGIEDRLAEVVFPFFVYILLQITLNCELCI